MLVFVLMHACLKQLQQTFILLQHLFYFISRADGISRYCMTFSHPGKHVTAYVLPAIFLTVAPLV